MLCSRVTGTVSKGDHTENVDFGHSKEELWKLIDENLERHRVTKVQGTARFGLRDAGAQFGGNPFGIRFEIRTMGELANGW